MDSILAQTFRGFELVVADDGSTDNSLEILQSYAKRYPDVVRVLAHLGHQNLGISETMNLATTEARGEYWCGHASDDVSYPDRLMRQVEFMDMHPEVEWTYGVIDSIDKDGAPLREQTGADLSGFPELLERLILDNCLTPVMVRMKCLREVGLFEPGLKYSDWEYWIRLAARYPAGFLPGAVGAYRIHENNTGVPPHNPETLEVALENIRSCAEVFAKLRRKADGATDQLGRPRIKALLDLRRAVFLLWLRDKSKSSRAAEDVFRSDPTLRHDLQGLASYLSHFKSLRVAGMMIRALGFPPSWLADGGFMSALWQIGTHRFRRRSSIPAGPVQV